MAAPSLEDPVVRTGSEVLGGPLGRHAGRSRSWWTPLRVLLALTFLTCGVGLVQKQWCRDNGWAAPGNYVHACYSDIPPLFFGRGLADGEVPYVDQAPERQVEYPVLSGAVMWLTAQAVPTDGAPGERSLRYFDVNALLLAVAAAVAVAATALTHRGRPWDAAVVALAPSLALAGTINWDLYAVALTSLATLAWARSRPVAAGVLLGLAAATKFYPLFLLGPLVVLCLRAGRLRAAATTVVAAVLAWLAVNVPVMVVDLDGWARFYSLSRERGAGFGSVWFVLQQQGLAVPDDALNSVAGGLFALSCAAVAVLALRAPRRPRLPQVAFLVVAAFLLTNKVYSPQYVLWLLPLAALARPRWRDVLVWQAGEALHFLGTWLLIAGYPPGDADRALGEDGYGLTVLAHVAGTLWLAGVVVRDVLQPGHDPVRTPRLAAADAGETPAADAGETPAADAAGRTEYGDAARTPVDDPAGGVLDRAPDRVTLRARPTTR